MKTKRKHGAVATNPAGWPEGPGTPQNAIAGLVARFRGIFVRSCQECNGSLETRDAFPFPSRTTNFYMEFLR